MKLMSLMTLMTLASIALAGAAEAKTLTIVNRSAKTSCYVTNHLQQDCTAGSQCPWTWMTEAWFCLNANQGTRVEFDDTLFVGLERDGVDLIEKLIETGGGLSAPIDWVMTHPGDSFWMVQRYYGEGNAPIETVAIGGREIPVPAQTDGWLESLGVVQWRAYKFEYDDSLDIF